jgi:hypothetical protein
MIVAHIRLSEKRRMEHIEMVIPSGQGKWLGDEEISHWKFSRLGTRTKLLVDERIAYTAMAS